MQDRLTVVADPASPGEISHTVNAVVVTAVIAQVNKFTATLLLAALTAQTCK